MLAHSARLSGSFNSARRHMSTAPAWCGIIDLSSCRSPMPACSRMPNQKPSIAAMLIAISIAFAFLFGYMPRITASSRIAIGAAISPAM